MLTRREFGKLALGVPAAAILGRSESIFGALMQAKPNSLIDGVQIGTITYSYRSMLDQSAEATLKYIVDSGISGIELMGGPVESFAGAPTRGGRGGGGGGGRGRGAGGPGGGAQADAPPMTGSWNGQPCAVPDACWRGWARRRGRRTRARRDDARAAGGAAGAGRQAQGVAYERLDGRVQEAAPDVQRRRRDHLRLEAAQHEHVGRGIRVHLQRRGSPRVHAHHARAADRCGGSSSGSATSR